MDLEKEWNLLTVKILLLEEEQKEEKKYLSKRMFESYSKPDSYLEEHPNKNINGVIMSSGSLGHGLSLAVGKAYYSKITKQSWHTYVIISDGELNEQYKV